MTQKETAKLFAFIAMIFPRDTTFLNAAPQIRDVWQQMLCDIPYDTAEASVQAHASSSPFPPSIAEIRKYSVELKCPLLSADEAYKLASDARRKYGWCDAQNGMDSLPESVRATIRTYCNSFLEWCKTEEPQGVERSQFMKIYEAMKDRKQKEAALPPGVAEKARLMAGTIGLLEG